VVVINGSDDDVQRQSEAMLERRAMAKQAKASKVRATIHQSWLLLHSLFLQKKRKAEAITQASTSSGACAGATSIEAPVNEASSTSNGATAITPLATEGSSQEGSSTTTTSSEEERDSSPSEKRIRLDPAQGSGTKLVKKSSVQQRQSKFQAKASGSKLRTGSSVAALTKKATTDVESSFKPAAKDDSARKVYKSLFHSGSGPRPKERTSNWVTYNPYF